MIIYPAGPVRNEGVVAIFAHRLFSDQECQRILDAARPERWEEGLVGVYEGERQDARQAAVRSVRQQQLTIFKDGFPIDRIAYAISQFNSQGWRFDLTGFLTDDRPWLMRYDGSRGDHSDWHIDVGRRANASRKLAFSLQLSDPASYDGGDLEFLNVPLDSAAMRERGALVIFPSFWSHRVTPVIRGARYAAVGWMHGPTFR